MFSNETYLFRNSTENSNRYGEEYRVNGGARRLYRLARQQARLGELLARLTGRGPRQLAALSAAHAAARRYASLRSVPLSQIRGSVDRAGDYDAAWRPLSDNDEQRWQRVATARAEGRSLPPVQLIRVGNVYYVQDGHHRVSVAQARGERDIEAEVSE